MTKTAISLVRIGDVSAYPHVDLWEVRMRTFRLVMIGLLAIMALALPGAATAQDATPVAVPDQWASLPQLNIAFDGTEWSGIEDVAAGQTLVTAMFPPDGEDNSVILIKIDADVQAWLDSGASEGTGEDEEAPAWFYTASMVGVGGDLSHSTAVVDLSEGDWFAASYPSYANFSDPFTVSGPAPAEPLVIEADLTVMGVDYAFGNIPDVVPAGDLIVSFMGMGDEPHEFVIMKAPAKLTLAQWTAIWAWAGEGEPPADMGGVAPEDIENMPLIAGIPATSAGMTSTSLINLEPGEYIAVCFIGTADGLWHPQLGMIRPFTVE